MESQQITCVNYYDLMDLLHTENIDVYEKFTEKCNIYFEILENNFGKISDSLVIPYYVDLCNYDPIDILVRKCLGKFALQNGWIFLISLEDENE